eukprot:m.442876 g.442876  ORF g.442876 m.442876 type:complete len:66 (-) comp134641_c0_seq1:4-201(-)
MPTIAAPRERRRKKDASLGVDKELEHTRNTYRARDKFEKWSTAVRGLAQRACDRCGGCLTQLGSP